jgi:hypothetical protein
MEWLLISTILTTYTVNITYERFVTENHCKKVGELTKIQLKSLKNRTVNRNYEYQCVQLNKRNIK